MNKDEIRQKVLSDIFGAPSTLLPAVGGLSLVILSWALELGTLATFAGILGVLAGGGILATRLIFGLEDITQQAYEYELQQKQEQRESELDQLDAKLTQDRDSRTQTTLRQLRELYASFLEDVKERKAASNASEVVETVESLFEACVKQLQHSHDLWEASKKVSGQSKDGLRDEREKVILEVVETVGSLSSTIEQFHNFQTRKNNSELARLRDELGRSLEVAKRTEERVTSLDVRDKIYDESEFE